MTQVSLQPRVSEKAYGLSKERNVYVFDVPKSVSKQVISSAVAAQFNVSVLNVNTTTIKGKQKRMMTKRGKATKGQRKDVKRAYVTIKEGDTIPVFAVIDEAEKKAEKAAAKEKK